MEKRIWKAKVLPGKLEEYIRRHDEIWTEMTDALNLQGIHNYTIWNNGDELIGYYECESLAYADQIRVESEVLKKWAESMQGIMVMEKDPVTGKNKSFVKVFSHK